MKKNQLNIILMMALVMSSSWSYAKQPSEADIRAAINEADPSNKQNKMIRKTGSCDVMDAQKDVYECPVNITYHRKSGQDQSYNWRTKFKYLSSGWVVSN